MPTATISRFLASGDDQGRSRGPRRRKRAPLVRSFRAHPGYVWALAFHPDGGRLATGSRDEDEGVKVWETTNWTVLHTYRANVDDRGEVCGAVAFSPNGTLLASAGLWDWKVCLWETETGRQLHRFDGFNRATTGVAFSPDGHVLAAGSIDGTVHIREVQHGRLVSILQRHVSRVMGIAFRPDGKQLAVAVGEGSVSFWDTSTWTKTLTVKVHVSETSSVAYSPDGARLATASYDQTAKVIDTTSGAILFSASRANTATITTLAYRPDGRQLATAGVDGYVRIWDMTPRALPR